ncbi:hypothetical protein FSARC_7380 [Fusarium sarcochroum]|uniref:Uncharacterized protein n=1 Tax=Fusarium sarcochroum TaxID=1208366 RepID=A0A8H4TVG7_9HYPO|nr:hypothetical protein FSARC_7380 [Fusarium sarcochroum]
MSKSRPWGTTLIHAGVPYLDTESPGMTLAWPSTLITGALADQRQSSMTLFVEKLFSSPYHKLHSNSSQPLVAEPFIERDEKEWAVAEDDEGQKTLDLHLGKKTVGPYSAVSNSTLTLMLMREREGKSPTPVERSPTPAECDLVESQRATEPNLNGDHNNDRDSQRRDQRPGIRAVYKSTIKPRQQDSYCSASFMEPWLL